MALTDHQEVQEHEHDWSQYGVKMSEETVCFLTVA